MPGNKACCGVSGHASVAWLWMFGRKDSPAAPAPPHVSTEVIYENTDEGNTLSVKGIDTTIDVAWRGVPCLMHPTRPPRLFTDRKKRFGVGGR